MRGDALPTAITALGLLAWSLYSYLTVRIDSDILAEALQVQRLLERPAWVLSYPGQLYGGVLEYPLMMIAEAISPTNPYAFTLLRILYLPVVGVLVCINVRRLDPRWSLWPVAVAALAGPAVLHGFMAVKDLYPFSWVIAMGGVTLLYQQLSDPRSRWWVGVVGGALVGLGIYQHPTTSLFSIPLVVAGLVHWRARARSAAQAGLGIILGLIPFVLALVAQPGKVVVYESAHAGWPQLSAALGLSTAPDAFASAVLPNAWGVQFTDINTLALPAVAQVILNAALALGVLASVIMAIPVVWRFLHGRQIPRYGYLVVLWATFGLTLLVLTTFVRPVFFYGAGVAILVWVTLGALPSVLPSRPRIAVVIAVVALMAVTSVGSVLAVKPLFPHSITFKRNQVDEVQRAADSITAAGIPFVYGTYWEALPIAFASDGSITPITSATNRFPADETAGETLIAVPDGHTALPVGLDRWPGSQEAWAFASGSCREAPELTARLTPGIAAFTCPEGFIAAATGQSTR